MFLTARWFPLALALLNLERYAGFIGFDYWTVAQNEKGFQIREYVVKDLRRPFFEPFGFCGAWISYTSGQSAAVALDLPAHIAAGLLHSAVNRQVSCEESLTTPRGQILAASLAPIPWFVVGLSVRRLAQRRWRDPIRERVAGVLAPLAAIPLALGSLLLLGSMAGLFVSGGWLSIRLAGLAFWLIYPAMLYAERVRRWPFGGIGIQ